MPDRAGVSTPVRNYMRGLNPRFFLRPGVEPQDDLDKNCYTTIYYDLLLKKIIIL